MKLQKNLITSLALASAFAMLMASCGSSKKMRNKAPAQKKQVPQVNCLVDCPPPSFEGPGDGRIGEELPPRQENTPVKSTGSKYEPSKYEPSKYEPVTKSEPVTKQPPVYVPEEPVYVPKDPVVVPKDPDPVVVQNACLNNANRVINVGGYNFTMSRYTTTFYTTIGSTGIYGNYVTILDGKPVSINNSFTHFVKDGVLKPSNGSSIKDATIVASGTTVSFANIDNDPTKVYAVGTGQYDVRFDTAPKGACLARYTSSMGDYSGGYPVLVLP